jgi:hypothetical protein
MSEFRIQESRGGNGRSPVQESGVRINFSHLVPCSLFPVHVMFVERKAIDMRIFWELASEPSSQGRLWI